MGTFKMWLLAVFLVGVCVVDTCSGFGTGAPATSCDSMLAVHYNNGNKTDPLSPQTVPAPFEVTVNKTNFGPGDEVEVTIGGGTQNFYGFFIQARVDGEDEPVGTFSDLTEEKMKFVECSTDYPSGAVTHANQVMNPVPFDSVVLKWTAPNSEIGDLKFYATVAQNHDIYWVKLESESLTYNGFTVLSPTLSLLLLPVAAIFTRYL